MTGPHPVTPPEASAPPEAAGPAEEVPDRTRRLSRRALLTGGLGAAALAAVGVPLALRTRSAGSGKLVPDLLASSPFYVAHRGGSLDWPEMSMEAYRASVARGADALEISLARTADGVWFGLHDETLDRTSGTRGMVAAEHTWAEVSALRINPSGPHAAGQTPQPYVRFEDLVAAYADTHTIFVDPKAVDQSHYKELLSVMDAVGSRPTDSFVAKYYGTGTRWATLARKRGYTTWGYYYGSEIASGATPLAATQADWDVLGLDVDASPAQWQQVLALGRPVVAHVVADAAAARRALAAGARGLMVSGVLEVLPPR